MFAGQRNCSWAIVLVAMTGLMHNIALATGSSLGSSITKPARESRASHLCLPATCELCPAVAYPFSSQLAQNCVDLGVTLLCSCSVHPRFTCNKIRNTADNAKYADQTCEYDPDLFSSHPSFSCSRTHPPRASCAEDRPTSHRHHVRPYSSPLALQTPVYVWRHVGLAVHPTYCNTCSTCNTTVLLL